MPSGFLLMDIVEVIFGDGKGVSPRAPVVFRKWRRSTSVMVSLYRVYVEGYLERCLTLSVSHEAQKGDPSSGPMTVSSASTITQK